MTRRTWFWLTTALAFSLLLSVLPPLGVGQASVQGQWTTLSNTMPINPVHVALLTNGKLLVIAGSGNCPLTQSGCPSGPPYGPSNGSGALLLDPLTGQTISQFSLSWDMFCNGMVLLEEGRPFIAGGTIQYDPFFGQPQAATFDPRTNTFSNAPNMAHGRWYPTLLTLGDGRVMTFSGLKETGGTNTAVEFYSADTGWGGEYIAPWTPDLYPWLHLLPNGKVFYAGAQTISKLFDPSTNTWNTNVATTNYSGMRTYGSSVLLPLTPNNNYDPKVMIMGGGNPGTNITEVIDMGTSTPAWQYGPSMSQARIEMNAVILPNGKVLALGGSVNDEDTKTASLNADLYDPVSNTFSSAGANAYPRLYHSVALLLPDATVWFAGGNPVRGSYVQQMEIYQPAYLFNANGTLATRPSITTAPTAIGYGIDFAVATPDAANISSVVLVRNGTVTHAFGMDQREVGLSFTAASGTLNVTSPPNSNIAPPGYYMLFILNQSGVPSAASFVQVTSQPIPQPDFLVTATPSSQTIFQGNGTSYTVNVTPSDGFTGNVNFSVTGLPSGATASISPSSVVGSGSSTLMVNTSSSTPAGTYTLTVTATSDTLTRSTQVKLAVNAYSVSATPSSQPVLQGSGTTYSVNVTPSSGFTGNVNFSVTGLPAGATASFSPSSVVGSGSSTLTVNTSSSTPASTSILTINGTSGSLTYSTQVILAVNTFSLTTTPSSQTLVQGNATTYSLSVKPSNGFAGNVSFNVTGLPAGATASFSPSSVAGSGSSTLTVNTSSSTPIGTYTLTITATSGSVTRSTPVSLVVNPFAVAATPSSQPVLQGSGTSYSVSVTAPSGFTGNVSFSVTGLPSGATLSFSPSSVVGPGSTTMTVTTSSSTPIGTYTLTVAATSGTVTCSAQVKLVVNAFSVATTPSSQTIMQGNGANYIVSVTAPSGSTGNVSFNVTGLPSGATASFSPSSVAGSGSSTLTVTTSSSTPTGTYTLAVAASNGTLTYAAQVKLVVNAFLVAATPSSQTLSLGKSTSYNVSVTTPSGFTGNVSLNVTGLPSGVTASFAPSSLSGSGSSTLTVNASSSTPGGTYNLMIAATSGTLTYSTQVRLVVVDFLISASPSSQTVSKNSSTTYNVTTSALGPFTAFIGFTVSGLPAQTSASFSPTTVQGSGQSTLTISPGASAPSGTYPLTITGSGGGVTHSTQVNLSVAAVADFSIAATPSSRTVSGGNSTSYTVSVTPSNGFTGNVSFSVTGLPTGATASFAPTSVPGSGSSTLTLNTSSSTPTGTYTLTITATSGALTHTTQVNLAVADFSIAATPSSQTVSGGNSTSYAVSVTPSNGFTGNVTFSVSGLPTGATASFAPTSVPGSGSSTLTLNTSSSTPTGTYTLTITATSGTLTHTTQVKLAVAAVADFSIAATPSSQTVSGGNSTSYTVSVTPSNGFTGNVSFSVSELPTGATASFAPTSVPGSGSSTLTLNTSSSTPTGTYTLTITATSGTLTHTTQVKLAVAAVADFSISVSPSSQTVSGNSSTTYTITVSALGPFTASVKFNVSGLPQRTSASFSPATVAGSGTSTLTISAKPHAPSATYPLTITGSGGGVTHSTNATLVIQ